MGFGRLFGPKKPPPASPDPDVEPPEEKDDVPPTEQSPEQSPEPSPEPSAKLNDANVVYPFHDEKATSFPPPLAVDASVFTDPQTLAAPAYPEVKNGRTSRIEERAEKEGLADDEKERKDELKAKKIMLSSANGACDSKTCTKEGWCSPETCETTLKKPRDSGDKISPVKLTEMINSSIKEAMQTIVKQCRMEEEKDLGQKAKEELDKPIRYANKEEISAKAKQFDRSRSSRNAVKSSRLPDKCQCSSNVRPLKKPHEECVKAHSKKENVFEDARNKRHSKAASNVRTDNRRMTGNVNIYICSEATENTQATGKQKKSPPCTGTSSETTTERSNISSSKLVSSIQRRRRKSKEQASFDSLPKTEESNDCSCVTKYTDSSSAAELDSSDLIDICNAIDENVSAKDTESSLIEFQCTDAKLSNSDVTDKSSSSSTRSKFIICDQLGNPCTSIYPSQILTSTDSEKWSSQSICCSVERVSHGKGGEIEREIVPCGEDRRDNRPLGSKSICSNYYTSHLNRDSNINEDESYKMHSKRNFTEVCNCQKKDREKLVSCSAQSNQSKRRKTIGEENLVQPWSTCSCIAEEEEEEAEEDVTVCKTAAEGAKGPSTKYVASKGHSIDLKKSAENLAGEKGMVKEKVVESVEGNHIDSTSKAEDAEQQESEQKQEKILPIPLTSPTTRRAEPRLLKYILEQKGRSLGQATDQRNLTTPPVQNTNKPEELNKNGTNAQPEKKAEPAFLKKFNLPEHLKLPTQSVAEQSKQTLTQETDERTLKDEGDEGDKKPKKSIPEKAKVPFFSRLFKKIRRKEERAEVRSEAPVEEDDTTEKTAADIDTSNKTEISKAKSADKLPRKSTIEVKETPKEKRRSISSKAEEHNTSEGKNKTETNANSTENTFGSKENKKPIVNDATPKSRDSINKEKLKVKRAKREEAPLDVAKETQNNSKPLTSISNRISDVPSTQNGVDLTKEAKPEEQPRKSESEQITEAPEIQEATKESEVRRKSIDRGQKAPESAKATTRDEAPSRKVDATHSELESEAPTVCVQCVRRKSSIKVPKQAAPSRCMHHHEAGSHTVCTNTKFSNFTGTNGGVTIDNERPEEIRCKCCYLPISQCSNSMTNYPKSCLKKESKFCHMGSQESKLLSSYHDDRSWQECGCRRVIVCNNCCRPRNECSCTGIVSCTNCCQPKTDCSCRSVHKGRENSPGCRCMKSMFCLYCDNPSEKCACRAPVRQCSCCELSLDQCMCKDRKTVCEGRPVLAEPDNDRTMYVTAWKPREEVRRYFSRNLEDLRADSINECRCHEKQKPHNSDDLPYQRLSIFSDVMNELQQKMTESTCCTRCRKIPCCCNAKAERDEGGEERKIKYRVSPKARRKIVAVCVEKSKSKSPIICCKCDSGQAKSDRPKKIIVPICCACKSTPCRCKKSKSSQKKPKAKCYYCKSSPCVCIAARECVKPRPCRCAESPCRAKEKEIAACGKTSTKSKNNEEKIICVR